MIRPQTVALKRSNRRLWDSLWQSEFRESFPTFKMSKRAKLNHSLKKTLLHSAKQCRDPSTEAQELVVGITT